MLLAVFIVSVEFIIIIIIIIAFYHVFWWCFVFYLFIIYLFKSLLILPGVNLLISVKTLGLVLRLCIISKYPEFQVTCFEQIFALNLCEQVFQSFLQVVWDLTFVCDFLFPTFSWKLVKGLEYVTLYPS